MRGLLLLLLLSLGIGVRAEHNPKSVVNLVNRVCGDGASRHFVFELSQDEGDDSFTIGQERGKVAISANSLSALTAGLNWYLNHHAGVNISWSNLSQRVNSFPLPATTETHTTRSQYRYYLNYCTFSYSMAFWDWSRWEQEIDWMALHGVNLPLQVVGMDAVWYQMLTAEFGFTHDEASQFVAGPAFQGWWLMNNLTGHGGPNPKWWYKRQARLGRQITDRMRSLGMTPCIPGFVGMAPQKYVADSNRAAASTKGQKRGANACQAYEGVWCGFNSPLLLTPGEAFDRMAAQYYKYVKRVFGFTPTAYSMDPVHERGLPQGMGQDGYKDLCDAARQAMNLYGFEGSLWVAQEWQVNADQHRIDALPDDGTLLLDLSSERLTYRDRYGRKPYLFCMLHNYGGNVGMYGCVQQMLDNYAQHLQGGAGQGVLKGVGATPEGIETNPMLYDLLFELPWLPDVPDASQWVAGYAACRYGVPSELASHAWADMLATVYSNTNVYQQGCREPVFCARPNLEGYDASSWAGARYDWDKQIVVRAAQQLLAANLKGSNYDYDLVDFTRQALTDHAHTLQMELKLIGPDALRFPSLVRKYLGLMDDIDRLLGSVKIFRLGRWTGAARQIAIKEGHPEDADWMERNARMLITTWGDSHAATNQGGLRDYGNREWQGLIAGYYRPRWDAFFRDIARRGSCDITPEQWFDLYERPFVHGQSVLYASYSPDVPADASPRQICRELLNKYFQ